MNRNEAETLIRLIHFPIPDMITKDYLVSLPMPVIAKLYSYHLLPAGTHFTVFDLDEQKIEDLVSYLNGFLFSYIEKNSSERLSIKKKIYDLCLEYYANNE